VSESNNPEQPADPSGKPAQSLPVPDGQAAPAYPSAPSEVPPGYDQPAGYGQPTGYSQPSYPQEQLQQPAYQEQQYQQPPVYQGQYQQPPVYQGQQQGYPQPGYGMAPGVEQKSKLVAGLLGILLGGLGIHNFYLGNTTKALIQLLVSVLSFGILYIFMEIWGLIEGILILVGNENFRTDSKGIPLKD
jgi:TM2 domain-containing membrane protein YozV